MDGKTLGVRMQTTSSYLGNTCISRIEIDIPISFDFDSDTVRKQIYQCWDERRQLPENFTTANWFLNQINQFTEVNQITVGKSGPFGTYVGLLIKLDKAMGYTISCIEKLLVSGKSARL